MSEQKSVIYNLKGKDFFDFLNKMIASQTSFSKDDVIQSLLVMSLNPIDFNIAEKLCEKFIESEDQEIRNLSIMAVGHIARVYKKLVNEKLYQYIKDIYLERKNQFSVTASETLDDIQCFLHIPKPNILPYQAGA